MEKLNKRLSCLWWVKQLYVKDENSCLFKNPVGNWHHQDNWPCVICSSMCDVFIHVWPVWAFSQMFFVTQCLAQILIHSTVYVSVIQEVVLLLDSTAICIYQTVNKFFPPNYPCEVLFRFWKWGFTLQLVLMLNKKRSKWNQKWSQWAGSVEYLFILYLHVHQL